MELACQQHISQEVLPSRTKEGKIPLYCCILPLIFLLNHGLHAELEGVLPKIDRDALPQAAHRDTNALFLGLELQTWAISCMRCLFASLEKM